MANSDNKRQSRVGNVSSTNHSSMAVSVMLLVVSLLLIPAPLMAEMLESAENVRQVAEDFIRQQATQQHHATEFKISLGRLDSRLKLAACKEPPEAFLPSGAKTQGKVTVGVRCKSPKPWTVYLPARIRVYGDVITASRNLTRGATISPSDIVPMRVELSELRYGYFTNADKVIGKVVKRGIKMGESISPRRIKEPLLVHRGEEITIEAVTGALKVRVKGKALQDAAKGELVSVRNMRSKRIIQAVAVEAGTVSVRM